MTVPVPTLDSESTPAPVFDTTKVPPPPPTVPLESAAPTVKTAEVSPELSMTTFPADVAVKVLIVSE